MNNMNNDMSQIFASMLGGSAQLPQLPAMPDETMGGMQGGMGQLSPMAGYNKARRFGLTPDLKSFLMKYSNGRTFNKADLTPTIRPSDLLKF